MYSFRIKREILHGSGREEKSAPLWCTLFFEGTINRLGIYSCKNLLDRR
jgi:hypothetical protein